MKTIQEPQQRRAAWSVSLFREVLRDGEFARKEATSPQTVEKSQTESRAPSLQRQGTVILPLARLRVFIAGRPDKDEARLASRFSSSERAKAAPEFRTNWSMKTE